MDTRRRGRDSLDLIMAKTSKAPKAPAKRFEQLSPMFDLGPVIPRQQAEVVEEVFPIDEMVSTGIHRANTKAAMYEASRIALEAYKQAIEAAPVTGINPLDEVGVVAANQHVVQTVDALREASRLYDLVWRGRELVSLPIAVQTDIYNRSRVARAAKANGRTRSRPYLTPRHGW